MTPTRKGPLVRQMEGVADTISKYMADGVRHLGQQNGPVPYGSVEYTPDEVAQRELGLWFTRAGATPDVSGPYWDAKIAAGNQSDPGYAGPRAAVGFNRQMQKLWSNPAHRQAALNAMAPEVKAELADLIATGRHPGYARTLEDGKEVRLDEPGNAAEHMPGGEDTP